MSSDNKLVRLEKYVEKLLAGYTELKKEKQSLERKVVEMQAQQNEIQAENKRLKKELNSLDSERGVMHDTVSSLIGQIEQWESEIEEDSSQKKAADDASEEDESDAEAEEEEPTSGSAKKGKSDQGATAQKNLFSG
ncbi:MAG: hypothetical protein P8X39_04915 [Desulfofustis sp.]|jgi:peptidoglycan hydrolase CwlO-like protein